MSRPLSDKPSAIYARGYGAAKRELAEMRRKWGEAFNRLRERTERAERGAGIGKCHACVFWQRRERCLWGYCDMKSAADLPAWPVPWANMDAEGPLYKTQYRFCTAESFGCINFKAKAGPPNEG